MWKTRDDRLASFVRPVSWSDLTRRAKMDSDEFIGHFSGRLEVVTGGLFGDEHFENGNVIFQASRPNLEHLSNVMSELNKLYTNYFQVLLNDKGTRYVEIRNSDDVLAKVMGWFRKSKNPEPNKYPPLYMWIKKDLVSSLKLNKRFGKWESEHISYYLRTLLNDDGSEAVDDAKIFFEACIQQSQSNIRNRNKKQT